MAPCCGIFSSASCSCVPSAAPIHGRADDGRNLGRWFGTFLTKIGMKEDGLVFHSLRHTAITRMRQASVELSLVQEIVGHERDTVTDGYFGEGYTLAQKKDAIEKITAR